MENTRALIDRFRTDIYPHTAPWLAEATTAELAGTPGDFAVLAGKAGGLQYRWTKGRQRWPMPGRGICAHGCGRARPASRGSRPLFLWQVEVEQVGRLLALLRGHQPAIGRVHEIIFLADLDPVVICRTRLRRPGLVGADGLLVLEIRARQSAVHHSDVVPENVWVTLLQIEALLDDGLAVASERQAGDVIGARLAQVTRLHFEHVVLTVAILVDPLADGVACKGRINGDLGREVAPVGVDAPEVIAVVTHQNVGDLRRDDDLHGIVEIHHRRHSGWNAVGGRPIAGPAGLQVVLDRLPFLLGFRGIGRKARNLAPIVGRSGAEPLALKGGIFAEIDDLCGRRRCEQGAGQRGSADQASVKHGSSFDQAETRPRASLFPPARRAHSFPYNRRTHSTIFWRRRIGSGMVATRIGETDAARASEQLCSLGQSSKPVVVPQRGEAALARVAQAAKPNGAPHLGKVHPARRPLLSANQDAIPAALSPLRRQNPREEQASALASLSTT